MSAPETSTAAGLAYRSAGDPDAPVTLFVHGYPESSYMWRAALEGLARAGLRGIAPDLPGFGDSPPDPPGSWEHHMEALERFVRALELDPVALVTHDWGVLVGLRWACDHPDSVRSLTISDGGFFADRRWHDLANVMRTPGEGEKLVSSYTREAFDAGMRQLCAGIDDQALALDAGYRVQVRSGLHCAPAMHQRLGTDQSGGTVRFSLGVFNTSDQIEQTVRAIGEIASSHISI